MAKKTKQPTLKELKRKEDIRQARLSIRRKIKAEKKALYNSVPLEVRRKFIELMHSPPAGSTLAEVAKLAGIEDPQVGLTIYVKNLKTVKYTVLKQPEDVK